MKYNFTNDFEEEEEEEAEVCPDCGESLDDCFCDEAEESEEDTIDLPEE